MGERKGRHGKRSGECQEKRKEEKEEGKENDRDIMSHKKPPYSHEQGGKIKL